VAYNTEKRNPSDFALWKFTPKGEKRDMEWETPEDLLEDTPLSSPSPLLCPQGRSTGEQSSARGARLAPEGDIPSDKQEEMARLQKSEAPPMSSQASGAKPSETSAAQVSSDAGARVETRREAVSEGFGDVKPGEQNSEAVKVMGFPGWHLECSAMAMSLLGPTIDIHTGGIDHIPVHHTNEIAQSEAATGQPFAHYWLHNNHMKVNGTKISKSLGNGYTLQDLASKGFSPLDYRMFVLQGHYSNEGNFTFENLTAAKHRLHHWRNVAALRHQTHDTLQPPEGDDPSLALIGAIKEALNDDLNTPEALRLIDGTFSHIESRPLEAIDPQALTDILETIDLLLGLQLLTTTPDVSDEIKQQIVERARAREAKEWVAADRLRDALLQHNITVRDTASGSIWEYAQ
jgi:cysteinyl-tRNA synthetase